MMDVLCVDDVDHDRRQMLRLLREAQLNVEGVRSALEAFTFLERREVLVVVTAEALGAGPSGIRLLQIVMQRWPRMGRVLLSKNGPENIERSALAVGALLLPKSAD